MKRVFAGVLVAACSLGAWAGAEPAAKEWGQFRGYLARGLSESGVVPTSWNLEKRINVLWETVIPGLSHAAPIVWGDRIYLLTAVTEGKQELKTGLYGKIGSAKDVGQQQWRLLALEKATGKVLFNKLAHEGVPRVKRHTKATHCNSTPATDGRHVVAILASEGLFCFDLEGNLKWKKDLGPMDSGYFKVKSAQWGFASSPVIHQDKVVVQCDVQENSFLAVYNLVDGEEIWRTPRQDVPTWSTPTIVEHGGETHILVNGWHHTGAYDFATGKEVWKLGGGGDIPVPTPITAHGNAYFTSAHGKVRPMRAVRLAATGDLTRPAIDDTSEDLPWVHRSRGAYLGTPIVVGNYLYSCDGNGVLTCFDAVSGEIRYRERLGAGGGGFTASPVSDGKHLFFPGETGKVFVVRANGKFAVVDANELGESCLATPALSEGMLLFRTRRKLVAIGSAK